MLKSLTIKNIALIRNLTIELSNGLCVLSGETGAGKSLIIDSISLLLGLKADKSLISNGEKEASVLAVFELLVDSPAISYLSELGIEDTTNIMIYRKLQISGKNECRVNGIPFSVSMLKKLSSYLIDLHGQFDHQSLLKTESHIDLLDRYMPQKINEYKINLQKLIAERKSILDSFKEFEGTDREREQTIDFLNYTINEIENSNLYLGEDEELKEKHLKIVNQEKILSHLKDAVSSLDLGTTINVESSLSSAISSISTLCTLDQNISKQYDRLQSLKYEFQDILYELKNIESDYDFDPKVSDAIEDRIEQIRLLKKKYGNSYEEIMLSLKNSKERLEKLEKSKEIIESLNNKLNDVEHRIYELEEKLSKERKTVAKKFESEVLSELKDLGMSNSCFIVNFNKKENYISVNGFDDVEFMLSTNIGEPVKPLSKIISGGEMSRFMLGIKNITARLEKIETMIFDEIDTGISGKMGMITAEKLAKISRNYQVICVSHLPQICAMSDYGYFISKHENNGKTETQVKLLDENLKIAEVARLSGGDEMIESSLIHAKDLVNKCNKFKNFNN